MWRENVALGAGSLGLPFEGAFVKGSDALCWAADNTRKLRDTSAGAADDDVEAWTLISTRPFGAANKVPQENVPQEVAERVTAELLRAFETAAGLPTRYHPPLEDPPRPRSPIDSCAACSRSAPHACAHSLASRCRVVKSRFATLIFATCSEKDSFIDNGHITDPYRRSHPKCSSGVLQSP